MVTEAQRIIRKARRPLSLPSEGIELWTTYLYQRGFSPFTVYQYRRHVQRLLIFDPTPDIFSIESYLASLLKQGIQVNTMIHHLKATKSFYTFLYQHGLWLSNPADNIIYPKHRVKERPIPSTPDVRALLSLKMGLKDRLILSLFLDTGLRLSECASILIDRINLADREIIIVGKGGKERIIPFSASVGKMLEKYIDTLLRRRAAEVQPWLFPARRAESSTGHLIVSAFQKRISELCEQAGIGHLTPHQLRHFFATYQLRGGADVKAVSKMLGHASVATTLDIYHHVDRDEIKRIHDKHSPLKGLQGG